MSRRTGLSRVDVLILLLIVAFATGLVLSAVSQVREAAARMTCANNLKQIGLGVHNYHDTYQKFPPLANEVEGSATNKGFQSAFALITPYLEASPGFMYGIEWNAERYHAHSSVTFPYRNKDGSPGGVLVGGHANRGWKVFRCPLDTTGALHQVPTTYVDGRTGYHEYGLCDVPMTLPDGSTGYYATGSYAANGQLPWGRERLGSISASTANVIMFAERPQVCRTAQVDVTYNLWGVGFYSPHMPAFATLTPTEPAGLWSTGQIAPVEPLPDEGATDRDSQLQVRVGRTDAAPETPDFPTPIQRIRKGQPCDPRLPSTPHPGGMQVLMADASARVFTLDTSPWVFWKACTPNKPAADAR